MALASTRGGGGGPVSAPASKPFWERAKTSSPPPAVAARPLPQAQPQYQPAPPRWSVPAPLAYALEQGPPRAPDLDYIYWRQAAEELRREWEHQQGDSIRIPLPGEPRAEGWQPLGRMPELESDAAAPMPRQMQPSFPTSPLMSIPLVNQIAPFVLALVETAAQAQPGTFDAAQPEGTLEAALQDTWGNVGNEGAARFVNQERADRAQSARLTAQADATEERLQPLPQMLMPDSETQSLMAAPRAMSVPDAAVDETRHTPPAPFGLEIDLPWGGEGEPARPWSGAGSRLAGLPEGIRLGVANIDDWLDTPGSRARGEERAAASAREAASRRIRAEQLARSISEEAWTSSVDLSTVTGTQAARKKQKDRKENLQELDLEDWNALSPMAQAAVESNLSQVTAVENDRAVLDTVLTPEQRRAYLADYERVFGETDFPEEVVYAPDTVALLGELGVQPHTNPYELDDYLRGDTLTTMRQVRNIERELPGPVRTSSTEFEMPDLSARQQRLQFAQSLAQGQMQLQTRVMEEEIANGKRLLSGMTYGAVEERAQEYSAEPATGDERPGQRPLSEDDEYLSNLFLMTLADRENDLVDAASQIQLGFAERGVDQGRQQQIIDRMKSLITTGITSEEWFTSEREQGRSFRNPQQVAGVLGMTVQKAG